VRVEDRHLEAARTTHPENAAENLFSLLPGEATGAAIVDGCHQIIVENIDVEMHPKALKMRLGHRSHHSFKRALGALLLNLRKINDGHSRVANMLVEKMVVIVESTEADEGDIFIANQWAEFLKVGKYIGAASRRNRKVEGCDLTVWLVGGVLEVSVTVEEDEAVRSSSSQCEQRPEQNAAVPAEQNGEPVALERGIYRNSDVPCDRCNPLEVQDPCLGVMRIGVRRHVNPSHPEGTEAGMETRLP
jgi:hypothetical protein